MGEGIFSSLLANASNLGANALSGLQSLFNPAVVGNAANAGSGILTGAGAGTALDTALTGASQAMNPMTLAPVAGSTAANAATPGIFSVLSNPNLQGALNIGGGIFKGIQDYRAGNAAMDAINAQNRRAEDAYRRDVEADERRQALQW